MKRFIAPIIIVGFCTQLSAYRLGIDTLTAERMRVAVPGCNHPRIGLLTNQTGKDSKGRATVDVVRSMGMDVRRLFVPEHGLHGTVQAAKGVGCWRDRRTGLPVVGLIGDDGAVRPVKATHIVDLDLLVVDLQDCGMRHFTYSGFLFYLMDVAAQFKKPLMVLDRPNPLGGVVEGPCVKRDPQSLIARAPVACRHGLTMGELARFYNAVCLNNKVLLEVVPMEGYRRTDLVDDILVAHLSPNVNELQAVYGYSFLGVLGEVRPFDVGLGTEHAMTCCALSVGVMSNKQFWVTLAANFAELGLTTKPLSYWSPRKKAWCRGLKLVPSDTPPRTSFMLLLALLDAARKANITLSFGPYFDRAVGDSLVRRYALGRVTRAELINAVRSQLTTYLAQIKPLVLYQPAPRLGELK